MSPIPAVGSFGGMIFSGFAWGIPELVIVSLVVLFPVNLVYYGLPLFETAGKFILAYREQKYKQSISKSEANEHEKAMTQMKYDQEYRMKQLEYGSNKKGIGDPDNTSSPAANVAEETHRRYLS